MKRQPDKSQESSETRILIDTSVWLDVAKDYRQQTLLSALEELTRREIVVLLVPDIVREEFAKNKARIIEDSRRSLSSTMKRVKEVVNRFGADKAKPLVLEQLNEIDHRASTLGEAARLAYLLGHSSPLGASRRPPNDTHRPHEVPHRRPADFLAHLCICR